MTERFGTEEQMNLEIANRLVALRKEKHLSQEALAEKLGISRQAVSKWERAEASPDTDNLIALAKLYHVSLDELLKIHEDEETDGITGWDQEPETCVEVSGGAENEGQGENGFARQSDYDEAGGTEKETSGENGQNGEDEVHIGFHGIHVKEHDGDEVHIGWDGIHVHDKENEVHIDRHGIYVNGEEATGHLFRHDHTEFPLWLLAFVIHMILGFCFGFWWTGMLIYLLVPVISTFIRAVRRRNPYLFAYPVLVTFIYLYVGLVYSVWYPTGVLYLTIPLYYSFLRYIRNRSEDDEEDREVQ